jgi:hypothetical protein
MFVALQPRIRPSRGRRSAHGFAFARHHLPSWNEPRRISRPDRNSAGRHRTLVTRSQSSAHWKRNRHDCNSKRWCNYHRRYDMFDRGDVAIGNVRTDRQLRRRRNGARNRATCHRGNNGPHGDSGNINIVGNVSSVGSVDNVTGHVGNVGKVRLRLE